METLTMRELQCFHALIQGASPKQVARQLGLSPRTIEEHIARFKAKLNIKTFDQLMDYAMANDLLQVTPLLQVMLDHANIATA
ncbi:MAG: LuxR C-terminal-related transcriptional regulator [Coxiellaceae bacterium]|nr:LuxR C-terminal-related transcriptional regulator [Coxiellaceae bacterium]